jgi:hypothetical protein
MAKSWAPAWRRALTTAGISERLAMVGALKGGYARCGAYSQERRRTPKFSCVGVL